MKLPNVQGPVPVQDVKNVEIKIDLPSCVKIVTQKDQDDFNQFVNSLITAANNNCLALLAEVAKKLGAS